MNKQQMISEILAWAPGNADREILESMTEKTLKDVHGEAWQVYKAEQEDQLLQMRASLAAQQAVAEITEKELIETRRPQFEAQQRESEAADRKTFATAARQLRFSLCEANFSMIRQVLGSGFTVQDIEDKGNSLQLGVGFELVPATTSELQQWGQERIQNRNQYLANTDPQTLRVEAKTEAVQNRQTAAQTAFERELEAGLTRDITIGGKPRLPDNWLGKRLDPDFIRRANKETLKKIITQFGSFQLTARLHNITRIGNFKLD